MQVAHRHRRVVGLAATGLLAGLLCACGTTVPLAGRTSVGQADQFSGGNAGPDANPGAAAANLGTAGGTAAGGSSTATGSAAAGTVNGPVAGGSEAGAAGPTTGPGSRPVTVSPTTGNAAGRATGGKHAATKTAGKPGAVTGAGKSAGQGGGQAPIVNGPGVSATQISFGYIYGTGGAAEQAALGNTTAGSVPDSDVLFNAVVKDVNSSGGVNGRMLNPIPETYSSTTTDSASTLSQAFCSDYTEDNHVLLVFDFATPDLITCLGKSGVLSSAGSQASFTDAQYAQYSNYFDTQAISLDTLARNLVPTWQAEKYFTAWNTATGTAGGVSPVKVGILAPDDPNTPGDESVVKDIIVPALQAAHIEVDPSDIVFWDASTNQGAVSGITAAELQFASDKVTHVIPLEVDSLAFFSQAANSQEYHPRYGISSLDGAEIEAGTLIPASQLTGALGLGWLPTADLPTSVGSAPQYQGPGQAHCLAAMAASNVDLSSQTAQAAAFAVCDQVYAFRDALAAIPKTSPINVSSVIHGLEGLGTGFPFASGPSATFGPGKHYPIDEAWQMQWSTGCSCQQYTGSAFPLT